MAAKTTTKRTARKTTKATARKSRKPSILGLPIEGAGHETPRAEIADYIDTEGMELPEPQEGLSEKKQAEKDRKFVARQKAKQEREAAKTYHGPAIPARRLFKKKMDQFSNCDAVAFAAITDETVTYFNLYNGKLTASYSPDPYRFPIKPKKLAKLEAEWVEVEVTDWPEVVTNAAPVPAKRTRKAK